MNEQESIEKWEGDFLDRKKYADFLTGYLKNKAEQERDAAFVMNINAAWGSGKTFFVDHWADDLRGTHPVVFFNAWQNDYSDDPLLSVISSILDDLQPLLGDTSQEHIDNLLSKSGRLLKTVAPLAAKGLLKKFFSSEEGEEIAEVVSGAEKEVCDVFGKATEELLKENNKQKQSIEEFKTAFSAIIETLYQKHNCSSPTFIFIDELDRCRPLYAIELLEKIKHLFDVKNVVFVLSTDTQQLSCSIKAIYGNEFDAELYLKRFFDQTYTLPQPDYLEFARMLFLDRELPSIPFKDYQLVNERDTIEASQEEIFSVVSDIFQIDLRTQKQCFEKYYAILSTWGLERAYIHYFYLLSFIVIESKSNHFFASMFDKNYEEISIFIDKNSRKSNKMIRVFPGFFGSFSEIFEIYINVHLEGEKYKKKLHTDAQNNTFADNIGKRYKAVLDILRDIESIRNYPKLVEMVSNLD